MTSNLGTVPFEILLQRETNGKLWISSHPYHSRTESNQILLNEIKREVFKRRKQHVKYSSLERHQKYYLAIASRGDYAVEEYMRRVSNKQKGGVYG